MLLLKSLVWLLFMKVQSGIMSQSSLMQIQTEPSFHTLRLLCCGVCPFSGGLQIWTKRCNTTTNQGKVVCSTANSSSQTSITEQGRKERQFKMLLEEVRLYS